MPRLKEGDLEKASRLYKAKIGVGCDGFHPTVPLDLTKETSGEIVEFLEKVEQSGSRSIALIGTLPTGEMEERSSAHSVGSIDEKERFNGRAKAEDQGAVALVLDLAKAFERASVPVVWAWATHFSFPRKILRVRCGNFEHQRRVQFEGCAAEPLTTITTMLPGSKWSCLLLRIVLQDALSEVTKICTSLKLRVFEEDITALVKGKKEVAETAKKVMKKLKEEEERPQVVSL